MQIHNAPSPDEVGQELTAILLSFPACAIAGVQWHTLVQKYEERHNLRLSVRSLGHSSALAAASALLWDIVRIVNMDLDNPVLVVEDAIALTPKPGLLGCWPSLYVSFCQIVNNYGERFLPGDVDGEDLEHRAGSVLLLSQLKPLLVRHWHANFDESSSGFVNENGNFCRFKKLKHLVQAVLRWREQRVCWCEEEVAAGRKVSNSALDNAVAMRLEMVPAAKQSDLELRCFPPRKMCDNHAPPTFNLKCSKSGKRVGKQGGVVTDERQRNADALLDDSGLRREVERLRAENAALKSEQNELRLKRDETSTELPPAWSDPVKGVFATTKLQISPADESIFDDPYEPPPQARTWCQSQNGTWFAMASLSVSGDSSTCAGSEAGTPTGRHCTSRYEQSVGERSCSSSGALTPLLTGDVTPQLWGRACHFMPSWFSAMRSADVGVIPNGIVQCLRERYELAAS
jgi:hypothetical protein